VKLLGVNGVLPTPETIANGSYPLATEVYVVIRADAAVEDPARLLRDWLLTEEGQAIVAKSGYIPLK
jgi:ABC-type phosphate transport system substrate-binding protein